jgi:predicted RNA-binding Zn-ribbon protein involved in translation (DUF1610 family)
MSAGWINGRFESFECPVCGDRRYAEVRVQRLSGNWYTTPFYECFGCSVMFRDPVSFSGMCIRPNVDASQMRPGANWGAIPNAKSEDDAQK